MLLLKRPFKRHRRCPSHSSDEVANLVKLSDEESLFRCRHAICLCFGPLGNWQSASAFKGQSPSPLDWVLSGTAISTSSFLFEMFGKSVVLLGALWAVQSAYI